MNELKTPTRPVRARMYCLFSIWLCAAPFALAETPNPAVVIDGELIEPIWQKMLSEKLAPTEAGVSVDHGGEIRTAIVSGYLYLGAHLPEPSGRVTARSIGINPNWEDGEDLFRVRIGANLVPFDWVLQINPLGACSLEQKGQSVINRKFLVATRTGEDAWSVELAVPLHELRSPRPETVRLSAERIRAMRPGAPEQRWRWPEYGPVGKVPVLDTGDRDTSAPLFRPAPLGNGRPYLEVGRVKILPSSSSGWDDPAWKSVPVWSLLRNEPLARLPRFPAEVKCVHDGNTLAVMVRCAEPESPLARVRRHDGPIDHDDSFQVYLSISGSSYVKLAINPAGYLLDAAGESGGPYLSRPRVDWNSTVQGIARQEPGAWIARLDLPLDSLVKALGEVERPVEWRVLMLRSRPARSGELRETSVLPVIQTETPLCPARYQRLVLVDRQPAELSTPSVSSPKGELASLESRVLSHEQRTQMDLPGMLERYIRGRVRKILKAEKHDWEQVRTRADWERFRDPRLKALAASLGSFPPRVSLETRVTKEFQGEGYRRQDLVYRSRPGLWVTANLYLPVSPPARMPGIVIVHSHHRPRTQAELQDMGILWARAGCAVLIMDQIGAGERLQNYPWNREAYHSRYVMGMQLYLAGESLIKWMVWDIMRGVDLLLERPEVDPQKIILLGAVAGGGDPAAVTAALDSRITAVAPFNFGECMPEYPRFLPEKNQWPLELADPGWGEWESTRCLRSSIAGQFLPWMICASIAPRRFIYSFEMGWEVEKLPAWARYQKVYGFYNATDHLDEAHGFGPFPGPGECTNIGPAQRRSLYPKLNRWFNISIPSQEPQDRRPESELAALSPTVASSLSMKEVHELVLEVALPNLQAARTKLERMSPLQRREWLRTKWKEKLGDIEPNLNPEAILRWKKQLSRTEVEAISLQVEPGIMVPLLLVRPRTQPGPLPIVIAVSEGGKERFLVHQSREIESLLQGGVAVCLADVRGTGETSPDAGRGPDSEEVTLAATELMLGNTLLGARLKDLRTVIAYLERRADLNARRVGIWGDSHAPVNPHRRLLDELPGWQVGPEIQQQTEPLGGLLAVLGGLYEDNLRALAVRHGRASYSSILEDRFAYVPADIIVPGILEVGDLADVAASLPPCALLLEGAVDGRNRLLAEPALRSEFEPLSRAYKNLPGTLLIRTGEDSPNLVQWLLAHL